MIEEGAQPSAEGSDSGESARPVRDPGPPDLQCSSRATSAQTNSTWTPDERYRLLFSQNLAGVYCTTLDGRILDCNESMAAMLGYESRQELLSHPAEDIYFEVADRESFIARLRKTGGLTNSELRMRCKDGTPIYILENVSLVEGEEGAPTIIQGTMVDITERKRAEEALRESEQQYRHLVESLRRLAQHQQTVRDEERARIARELHDELGQVLTALNMDLHWLQGRSWHESETTQARITSMCDLMSTTLQAVHRICADLRPAVLDDYGLTAAIEWLAHDFELRTSINCQVSLPAATLNLPNKQATAVFRIFQESLTNIARHGQASEAKVSLGIEAGTTLVLTVRDNGVGITEKDASDPNSLGLAGMRERALRWGGHMEILGIPGEGTTVTLHMPTDHPSLERE